MKNIRLILPLAILLFASCEKVVNIDLNNASSQYVIEGEVYEGVDTVEVKIARTTDYYGKSPQQLVNNATVTLSDDAGNTVTIPGAGNGRYELANFTGVSGRTYQLKVVVDGKEFTASSVMQPVVNIDSVTKEFQEQDFRKEGYEVAARFTDPANNRNFYRMVYVINDTLQNKPEDLYLFNDKYNDGKPVKADLFRRFEKGDKIEFELRTMDEQVYDFFNSLSEALNNQNGPAPANPNTNIKGGALGYFGAFTSSRKSIVVSD
jgi:hypothetical protein